MNKGGYWICWEKGAAAKGVDGGEEEGAEQIEEKDWGDYEEGDGYREEQNHRERPDDHPLRNDRAKSRNRQRSD